MMKRSVEKCLVAVLLIATFLFFGLATFAFSLPDAVIYADSVSVWDGTTDTSWYVGHEADDEYTLTSAAQLAGLSTLSSENGLTFENKTIILGVDVDLDGCKSLGVGDNKGQAITTFSDEDVHNVWTPITNFQGTFNGNNHTIFNMSVKEGKYSASLGFNSGFVSFLTNGGAIRNLTFKNAIVSGTKNVGIACGKQESGVLYNIAVENSKILVGHSCAGGIAGVSTSVNRCIVRGLEIDCSLGGSRLIGGLIGGGAPYSEDNPSSVTVSNSEVYNFVITDLQNAEYVGLFAANKTGVTLSACSTNNTAIALSSGDFTVSGDDSVSYKNIEETTIDGNVAANTANSSTDYVYDADGMNGKDVEITFVSTPSSIQIACTGADAPDYLLTARTLTFTIPNSASSLTVTASMQGVGNVTATFDLGEVVTPPPTPTKITVEIDDKESVYGNPLATLTAHVSSGELKEGDNLYSVITLAKDAGTNVGTYDINVTATSDEYDVTWQPATYTITQRPLTLVVDDKTSVYGDDFVVLTAHIENSTLASGDNLEDMLSLSKQDGKTVGTYVINCGILDLNYIVQTLVKGTYTITPRPITVAVADAESVYGETLTVNTLTLTSGTLKSSDTLDEIVAVNSPSSFASGTYQITATATSANYAVTFTYTSGDHSTYTIRQKDATSLIAFSIQDGATMLAGQTVNATLELDNVALVCTMTLDGETVTDTKVAGNYTLHAKIDNPNYFGEKSISFKIVENAETKMTELASLLAIYRSTTATDEQKINALFDAQSIYANLTQAEIEQIGANPEYSALTAEFLQDWNSLRNGANEDFTVANSVYDKTIAIVLGAISAAAAVAFVVMKALL